MDKTKRTIKVAANPLLIFPVKPKMAKVKIPSKKTNQAWLKSIKITDPNKIKKMSQKIGFLIKKARARESGKRAAKNIAAWEGLPKVLNEEVWEKSKGKIKKP